MLLEVIATTEDEAFTAAAHGADRIELISAFEQGGLTPDRMVAVAVIERLKQTEQSDTQPFAKKIPVHAMVRPHSRSFIYDKKDISEMIAQIRQLRQLGVHALVMGALKADHKIDTESLQRLLDAAGELPVTFHRAFDEVDDQEEAVITLSQYPQIKWILTSGGNTNVLQAVQRIKRLVKLSESFELTIMPGSGLTIASLPEFIEATKAQAVHLGTGVRIDGRIDGQIDGSLVRRARDILDCRPYVK
ncbi:copper homeostasis protein CutC [Paenibacillus alkaliterrae]|uniref:copper homeostasis protein CutC n=1 Tax=Paenibacillus alkaliterrae TaxID=320909 RepID=UPI001F275AB4|nr:copper homeostasis protein CutC [Paenibacillus alkaliterrae]MCF2940422.1 copper homeostasis protein CutC [Paenibacillus alkaliterrae]